MSVKFFTESFFAEFLGTAFLLVIVTGSGIMGETLGAGNAAMALLGHCHGLWLVCVNYLARINLWRLFQPGCEHDDVARRHAKYANIVCIYSRANYWYLAHTSTICIAYNSNIY